MILWSSKKRQCSGKTPQWEKTSSRVQLWRAAVCFEWMDGWINKNKKRKIFCPLQGLRKISAKIFCVKQMMAIVIWDWLWSEQDQDQDPNQDQDQDQEKATVFFFFVFLLRFCPDVGRQLHPLQTPVFSAALNQLANELRDRCLHLILPACIRGESGIRGGRS